MDSHIRIKREDHDAIKEIAERLKWMKKILNETIAEIDGIIEIKEDK